MYIATKKIDGKIVKQELNMKIQADAFESEGFEIEEVETSKTKA